MSRMSLSPRPWSTEVLGHAVRVADAEGADVAVLGDVSSLGNVLDADLIAAAPDLLEACLALLDPARLQDAIDRARDAVRKVGGGR